MKTNREKLINKVLDETKNDSNNKQSEVKDPTYWGYIFLAIVVAVLSLWTYLVQLLCY